MIKALFARNIYEPLYSKFYKKDNRLHYYKLFKEAQWNSPEENRKIQAKKLYGLIRFVSENIPYYQNIIRKKKIKFFEKTIFNDIKNFPILTKEIIRSEYDNHYKKTDEANWYYNTSGGSTGEPVRLIQDKYYSEKESAMTRIQFEWAKYKYGEKQVKLWGSERDIFSEKENIKNRFANWMKSLFVLNSFKMDDNKMRSYVEIINKKKPKLILAYAQSINELAKFIEKNKLMMKFSGNIMTSAGVLYPSFREVIERVFKCRVFNRYGSREVGNIASECDKHDGLHLSIFTHFVEILDKNLKPCKEGETGEIYITLLHNFTMPLIRYKIGDMAIFIKKKCSCKRGMPLIKKIVGRDVDLFVTSRNELIDGEYFTHLFYFKDYIKKFQVIQKNKNYILIKLILKQSGKLSLNNDRRDIIDKIRLVMGKECKVDFKIVSEIKSTESGKYRYTIREF